MECRDYRGYEGKRKEEGGARGAGIRHLRKLIRGALHDADGRDAAGIVCPAGMAFRSHPYGVRAACMSEHPGSAGMYGLRKVPSRSGPRGRARGLAGMIGTVVALPGAQAGGGTRAGRCRGTRRGSPLWGTGAGGTPGRGSYPGADSAGRTCRWRRTG